LPLSNLLEYKSLIFFERLPPVRITRYGRINSDGSVSKSRTSEGNERIVKFREKKRSFPAVERVKRQMKTRTIILILIGILVTVVALAGCTTTINNSQNPETSKNGEANSEEPGVTGPADSQDDKSWQVRVPLPPFKGTVAELTDHSELIKITKEEWRKAKEQSAQESRGIADTIKQLDFSDFKLMEAWQGTLNDKPFQLDLYSSNGADFLLIASKYGDKVNVHVGLARPVHAFVFYGERVRLQLLAMGLGVSYNIASGEYSEPFPEEDKVFDTMAYDLFQSQMQEKEPAGSGMRIGANHVTLIKNNVLVVKE